MRWQGFEVVEVDVWTSRERKLYILWNPDRVQAGSVACGVGGRVSAPLSRVGEGLRRPSAASCPRTRMREGNVNTSMATRDVFEKRNKMVLAREASLS